MTYQCEPLGELVTIEREGIDPREIQNGARYVGLESINSDGTVKEVMVSNGELASTKFCFTPEHILFGKLRPYLRKVARPKFGGICSTDVVPIKPGTKIDRDYLFHFLRQDEVIAKAASLAVGINLPRLSPRILETFDVPVPPLNEQRRIAAILDQTDGLRRKRREALQRVKRLASAILVELIAFEDATEYRLDQLVRHGDRINYGVVQPGPQMEHGVPLIRVENVVDENFSLAALRHISPQIDTQYSRSRLRGDEILVACVGSIGAVALAHPDQKGFNIARAVARIPVEPNKADRIFIAEYLKEPKTQAYFKSETRVVAQPTLNIKQLCETRLLLPPLFVQRSFADRVAKIDRLKAHHRVHLAKLDALFASLQHRAFRGKL